MKTDWEYEQAVLDKLRLRRRKQRRARLTAGALAGVLAVVLSVGAAAVTIWEGRLPLETPLGPGNTSVQDSAALAAIREQLWEYAAAQSDALLFEKETTPDDLTVEVLGELNGYTFGPQRLPQRGAVHHRYRRLPVYRFGKQLAVRAGAVSAHERAGAYLVRSL